jgi:hypothetical protein
VRSFYLELRRLGLTAERAFVGAKMLSQLRGPTAPDAAFVAGGLRTMTDYQFASVKAAW